MRIGIISDTHDHVRNITRAVSLFRKEDVRRGDRCRIRYRHAGSGHTLTLTGLQRVRNGECFR